ncbi:hypothetical protein BJX61DRAFT_509826 [Aspergillus egyptiacus]|nr:hypothetical protein BJX61DRAFT_509826 [Aspergillus egyptiacus]
MGKMSLTRFCLCRVHNNWAIFLSGFLIRLRFLFSPLYIFSVLNQKQNSFFPFSLSAALHILRFLYYIFGSVGTTFMQNNWVMMGKSRIN